MLTRVKWERSSDPAVLLGLAAQIVTERKLRLFACNCCRQIWQLLTDPYSQRAVEVSERYADGRSTRKELKAAEIAAKASARAAAWAAAWATAENAAGAAAWAAAWYSARYAARSAAWASATASTGYAGWDAAVEAASAAQCPIVYDLINPFQPALLPAWRTMIVQGIALEMYAKRDFSGMGILGDALQDAGCDNEEVLAHCYQEVPHWRGCWLVDLILGNK